MLKETLANDPDFMENYIEDMDSNARINFAVKILNSLKN
jgi:hypothetical protein